MCSSDLGLSGVTIDNDGILIIPAGTPAGTYTIVYQICENLNSGNCDTASITVLVNAATITANDDDFSGTPIAGQTGGNAGDVTLNDTLNGVAVEDGDITISIVDPDGLNGVTIDNDGTLMIPSATPAGTYNIVYRICENLNLSKIGRASCRERV